MGLFGDNKENDTRAELAVAREEKAELEHVSLSEEETQMLAYLHVHNTPMPQIKRALLLGESQIDALLESEPVLAAIQIFEQEIHANAKTADDLYDQVEISAMAEVHGQIASGQIMDIKPLMSAAQMANKASRKSNRLGAAQQGGSGGRHGVAGDGTARLEQRPVVRLRAKFVKRMQSEGGEAIIEREAEIIAEGQNAANRMDFMQPDQVQSLVEKSLGVNMEAAQQRHTFGETEFELPDDLSEEEQYNNRQDENNA